MKVWIIRSESMDNRKGKYGQKEMKVWTTGSESMDKRK